MKKIIQSIFILIFMLSSFSCDQWGEDYFDETLPPTDNLNPDFTSNYEFEGILNGAYFTMKANGQFGIVDAEPALRIVVSDLVQRAQFSNTREQQEIQLVYERNTDNSDIGLIDWIWRSGYMVTQAANTVLDFFNNEEPFDDDLNTEANINRMLGESYFLRAFAHFRLAKTFAAPFSADPNAQGIILQLAAPVDAQDLGSLSTVGETYEQIIEDLKMAIELLPEQFNGSIHPPAYASRADRSAAKFLLAKVYFLMGDQYWGNLSDTGNETAMGLINDIIASGRFEPTNDISETWSIIGEPFAKARETVFAEDYFRAWRGNRIGRFFSKQETGGARFMRQFPMSNTILEKIGWDDETEALQDTRYVNWFKRYEPSPTDPEKEDPEFGGEYTQPLVWAWKSTSLQTNTPIFRSPELYLMRAAILVSSGGDKTQAMEDLNITRTRAGLAPLTDANAVTLDDVEAEWIKELSFEGSRLSYLQALKLDVGPGGRDGVGAVPYDSPSLYFTLPRREIELNPNLQ